MSQLVQGLHPCSPRSGFKVGYGLARRKIIKQENQNHILQPPTKQSALENASLAFSCRRGFWLLLALVKVAIKKIQQSSPQGYILLEACNIYKKSSKKESYTTYKKQTHRKITKEKCQSYP